jgi:arylsulfatase
MADEAIGYMKGLNAAAPEKPFFVYYVPGGTHAPHHPTPEWIKKISDLHLFDAGWNKLRDTIFANQKKRGVIPENTQLTPWPDSLPKWDTLNADEMKLFARQADVFAAYAAYTDNEIGRVIQAVELGRGVIIRGRIELSSGKTWYFCASTRKSSCNSFSFSGFLADRSLFCE